MQKFLCCFVYGWVLSLEREAFSELPGTRFFTMKSFSALVHGPFLHKRGRNDVFSTGAEAEEGALRQRTRTRQRRFCFKGDGKPLLRRRKEKFSEKCGAQAGRAEGRTAEMRRAEKKEDVRIKENPGSKLPG